MKSERNINRRNVIKTMALGSGALAIPKVDFTSKSNELEPLKGNINHSVCQWCFSNIPLETIAQEAKKIGLIGIDIIGAEGWDTLKKYGLTSTMCYGDLEGKSTRDLSKGWCDTQYHEELIKQYKLHIPMVAEAGWTNLICFSGNSRGIDPQTGLKNCVKGLKEIIPLAEEHGVVLHMELLNSKVDHNDYMCDNSEWGVDLCKALGSNNFKLLYDIYHMQIMEGDVIRTIRENKEYYGHFHTAGVPGRNEIDETQELFYPAIMEAIVELGFEGYVAQEFIPRDKTKEGLRSLADAIRRCDV